MQPVRKWAQLVRQCTTDILSINNLLARNLAKSSLRARMDPLITKLVRRLLWPDKQKLSKGHFTDEVIYSLQV